MTSSADHQPSCRVVSASNIAKSLLDEVHTDLSKLGRSPLLVGFLANDDPGSRQYADWTRRTCEEHGFKFELREPDREGLEDRIEEANRDPKVDGIIVYYPVFGGRYDQYLQNVTDVGKDVEGLGHRYIFNMYRNIRFLDDQQRQKSILPCTPLAIVKILEYLQVYDMSLPYGDRLYGHTITVINRSEVVGRPLAALLANDGATVYSVDINNVQQFSRGEGIKKSRHEAHVKPGWTLEDCLPLSDVVISGVPGEKFKVPVSLLKQGAVCINFSSEKNFPSLEVKEKASIYVPAIGKATIVCLLRNLLRIVQNRGELTNGSVQRDSTNNPGTSSLDRCEKCDRPFVESTDR
ncbi:MAG: hypothetical protein M1816_006898 [Peltula sp. TS41687]|nr:MAG: hypothetical protein M1816_006898 [Peltula sp. TS41687]